MLPGADEIISSAPFAICSPLTCTEFLVKHSQKLTIVSSRAWLALILAPILLALPVAIADPVPQAVAGGSDATTELSAVAQLGRKMFFDPSLSSSGQQSCASCHSPAAAYGPPNDLAVQFGGPDLKRRGMRAVPSLRYLEHTPNFSIGPNPEMADNDPVPLDPAASSAAVSPGNSTKVASVAKAGLSAAARAAAEATVPQGGLDWDGRANTFQDQALGPLLDPNEMDNHSAADVLERLKRAAYADDLKKMFGANIFSQPELALDEAMFALARFQAEEPSFHPYDSKYDAYLAGNTELGAAEQRGLDLFEDPLKGNCSSCHLDRLSRDGLFRPAFTDYQFEALGVPRNRDLPVNRDPNFHDLGLCGPMRTDYTDAKIYCGLFKTPTLRNVAIRKVFFHNGAFQSLDQVLHFYVERETNPAKWYPTLPNGEIDSYDDLPPQYRDNVDLIDAPYDRKHGEAPALNDSEIADIIAFLGTLTDGYRPGQPSAGAR
jgi:cytochrome c peroxidase